MSSGHHTYVELGRPLIPHRMEPTHDKQVNLLHRSAKKHRSKTQSQKGADVRPGGASKKPQGKPKGTHRKRKESKERPQGPTSGPRDARREPKRVLGETVAAPGRPKGVQRATQGPQKRSNGREESPKERNGRPRQPQAAPKRAHKSPKGRPKDPKIGQFSKTPRLHITLEAQPLTFRRLIFAYWRGRYDTDPSQVPRLRTKFDITKMRGFGRRARGF